MSWLDGLRARMRFLVRRSAAERELEEELSFHVERETERNMARGMTARAASRAARRSFGGGDRFREEVRAEWAGVFDGLGQDLRHGVRRLLRAPGFSLLVVLTLALGIGANTAIYSLVRSVLLEPLPYSAPDRLTMVWQPTADPRQTMWLSAREVLEYRAATVSFDELAAYQLGTAALAEGEPERVRAAYVTANVFAALGASALHGRTFTAREDAPGADGVVLLGHGLWQRQFGGDPGVVGADVRVNGEAVRVVGVMAPEFRLPLDYVEDRPTELWRPAAIDPTAELAWGDRSWFLIGRLADGASAERATADLERAFRLWVEQGHIEEANRGPERAAVPLDDLLLGDVRPALWILFGAVAFLLLIACANVAHLQLARSDARRRESVTQVALGAGRMRIARQTLVETGLLALGGGVLGIGFAVLVLRAVVALTPVSVIRTKGIGIDVEVLVFTALLALATTLAAGLLPALRLSRVDVARGLVSARGDVGSMRRGARRLLVVAETALSLVLVLGATLLARSFGELRRVDLGFEPDGVLTLHLALPPAEYDGEAPVVGFFRELVGRIEQLPRVEAAGAVRVLPLDRTIGDWSLTIEDRPRAPGENLPADWQVVTPGYLEAMRIDVVRGRAITAGDDGDAPLAAVINETMAARYWPDRDALGRRFHLGTMDQPWIEVVGIARDVRRNAVLDPPRPEMYIPHAQWGTATGGGVPRYAMTLVVRTEGDPLALLPAVRGQVRAIAPGLPISDVSTLDDVVDSALAEPRFTTVLLGVFALLALMLAASGLYGVISFVTARRTHEIGVRIALGARRRSVAELVMSEALAMTTAGIAVGLIGAAWLTSFLEGQLYGVSTLDASAFALAPAVLLFVAAAASYLPARRAARMNPVSALRDE